MNTWFHLIMVLILSLILPLIRHIIKIHFIHLLLLLLLLTFQLISWVVYLSVVQILLVDKLSIIVDLSLRLVQICRTRVFLWKRLRYLTTSDLWSISLVGNSTGYTLSNNLTVTKHVVFNTSRSWVGWVLLLNIVSLELSVASANWIVFPMDLDVVTTVLDVSLTLVHNSNILGRIYYLHHLLWIPELLLSPTHWLITLPSVPLITVIIGPLCTIVSILSTLPAQAINPLPLLLNSLFLTIIDQWLWLVMPHLSMRLINYVLRIVCVVKQVSVLQRLILTLI